MRATLPEPLDSTPFRVRDAEERGITRSALRSRGASTPYRGVRIPPGDPASHELLCRAYLERMPENQYFSHLTAARLWGMRLPTRLRGDHILDVTAVLPGRAPRMRGVRGHHVDPGLVDVELRRGMPVSSVGDTWRALATLLSISELVVVGDGLVRRKSPVLTNAQLLRAVARHGGRRGARRLRAAYAQVRPGTDSARETLLRLLLVGGGLPEPQVNAVVSAPGAVRRRYGDLVYRRQRVIVEYDGAQHREDPVEFARDVERLEELARDGWTVIRVLAPHFADPPAVVTRVRRALADAGPPEIHPRVATWGGKPADGPPQVATRE